jgi:hypothetical protein
MMIPIFYSLLPTVPMLLLGIFLVVLIGTGPWVHCSDADSDFVRVDKEHVAISSHGSEHVILYDTAGYRGYSSYLVDAYNHSHASVVNGGRANFYDYSIGICIDSNCSAYNNSLVYAHHSSVVDLYDSSTGVLFGNSIARIHGCSVTIVRNGIGNTSTVHVTDISECFKPHMNQFHAVFIVFMCIGLVVLFSKNRLARTVSRERLSRRKNTVHEE